MAGFDISNRLDELLSSLGLGATDTGGSIALNGDDPIFASRLRLGAAISLPMMACAIGAATLWRMRTGEGQDLELRLDQAIHGITPHYKFHPKLSGYIYPHPLIRDNPFLLENYQAADGRWVMACGVYPHMVAAWLRFLDCVPSPDSVARAINGWQSFELEEAAARQGLPCTVCRTREEWLAHPQGQLLANSPVVEMSPLGSSAAEPLPGPAVRPLSGVRVLSFTHAIAGPTVGRTLAEHGADVLNVAFPNGYEHDFVYAEANVGSRNCYLDLRQPAALEKALELVRQADVVVDNHRPGRMAGFGLSSERLAEQRPGLVVVNVSAFGRRGPWADRAGFDMNGSAASGIMATEAKDGRPLLPVTGMVNDFITGYFAAAGASAGLIRRMRDGGGSLVSVSLARTAMEILSLGQVEGPPIGELATKPETMTVETPLGVLHRLAPPVRFSRTPGHWSDPVLVYRGSSRPEWLPLS